MRKYGLELRHYSVHSAYSIWYFEGSLLFVTARADPIQHV